MYPDNVLVGCWGGGGGLGWRGTVCVSFYVLGAFFVLLVSELRFVWLFLQYQW